MLFHIKFNFYFVFLGLSKVVVYMQNFPATSIAFLTATLDQKKVDTKTWFLPCMDFKLYIQVLDENVLNI